MCSLSTRVFVYAHLCTCVCVTVCLRGHVAQVGQGCGPKLRNPLGARLQPTIYSGFIFPSGQPQHHPVDTQRSVSMWPGLCAAPPSRGVQGWEPQERCCLVSLRQGCCISVLLQVSFGNTHAPSMTSDPGGCRLGVLLCAFHLAGQPWASVHLPLPALRLLRAPSASWAQLLQLSS